MSRVIVAVMAAGCYSSGPELDDASGADRTGCRLDRECSDDDPCNGEEPCLPDGTCGEGVPPSTERPCPHPSGDGFCREGTCVPTTCGDGIVDPFEECDDGNGVAGDGCDRRCILGCRAREECDDEDECTDDDCVAVEDGRECAHAPWTGIACSDGNACTGDDSCVAGTCIPGLPRDCTDAEPCTIDGCEPAIGCTHQRLTEYHRDDDGDGWGAPHDFVCRAEPPMGYTVYDGDCCDRVAEAHPGADYQDRAYVCGTGDVPSFDYDCDGVEDPAVPTLATPCVADSGSVCWGGSGWCPEGGSLPECRGVPACGEMGVLQTGCTLIPPGGDPPPGYPAPPAGPPPEDTVDAGPGTGGPDARTSGSADGGSDEPEPPDAGAAKDHPDDTSEAEADFSGWVCAPVLAAAVQRCR
ncbi:MAG: DUF4215 domain-containing protein [Acidobacteria bacterium]|nr:DUF4215 domain-containing protein [Acidobacteriota bacterium]